MASFFVVDDSRVARHFIKKMLNELGHEVIFEADDGVDFLEVYEKLKPDFVTIDLEMPQIDGITISGILFQAHPDAKIIMITSLIDKKRTVQALNSGIHNVLTKPITTEQLNQAINSFNKG